jgi:hypothetical protein
LRFRDEKRVKKRKKVVKSKLSFAEEEGDDNDEEKEDKEDEGESLLRIPAPMLNRGLGVER